MPPSSSPLVTIGLPVYNGSNYITSALDSILAQTFEDFELVIVDNQSTDDTYEICRSYTSDPRVRLLRNEHNIGAAPNANRCVEEARGRYFKWAHHDDLIAPNFLKRCVEALEEDPELVLAFASGEYYLTQEGEKRKHPKWRDYHLDARTPHQRLEKYLRQYYPNVGSFEFHFGVMKTEALRRTPLMQSYASADIILFAELAMMGRWCRIDEPLFFYRYHDNQSHTQDNQMIWFDPKNEGKFQPACWRWLFGYLSAIQRVPMTTGERLKCVRVLNARFVKYVRKALFFESLSYGRHVGANVLKSMRASFPNAPFPNKAGQ